MKNQTFIEQLQAQASKQAILHQQRFLPRQLDSLTAFIGNNPWQVLIVLSGLTAFILRMYK